MYLRHLVNIVTDGDHDGAYPVLRSTRATHDLSLQASWIKRWMRYEIETELESSSVRIIKIS